MSAYTSQIAQLEERFNQLESTKARLNNLALKLNTVGKEYEVMLEAQQLLAAVSDANTTAVLNYITSIINRALAEMFPHDTRRVYLEKEMYQGQYAHINLKLEGSNGKIRDLNLQTGTGLRQIISFMFVISLITVRNGRRFFMADELLSGLHAEAKKIIIELIQLLVEQSDFQFAFVEYGIDDLGKIYLVSKPGAVATVTPLGTTYHNEIFLNQETESNV